MLVYVETFIIFAGLYCLLFRKQLAGRVRDDNLQFALEFGAVCLFLVGVGCQAVLEWPARLTAGAL